MLPAETSTKSTRKNILKNLFTRLSSELTVINKKIKKNTEENQVFYAFNVVQDPTVKIKLHKRRGCVEKDTLKSAILYRHLFVSLSVTQNNL